MGTPRTSFKDVCRAISASYDYWMIAETASGKRRPDLPKIRVERLALGTPFQGTNA